MNPAVRLELRPSGRSLPVTPDVSLQDVLFEEGGTQFPCGGRGRCRGCRVRVVAGSAPVTPEDLHVFGPQELAAGWRLGCRLRARTDLTLELAQWEALILGDDSAFAFTPRSGLGVAVDLGTTTVVVQLLDLATAHVLGVRTALNQQARHGADLMSRLDFATRDSGGLVLEDLVRQQVGGMIRELLAVAGARVGRAAAEVAEVVIVGNTVMHHLFAGLAVDGLARHPFEPTDPGPQCFSPEAVGWAEWLPGPSTRITFLPCLGSFVGSDILAGVLAVRMFESEAPVALVDLGTNGEIVVGNRDRMLCTSTAAGPAFEGARILMGMRAATGAISEVTAAGDRWNCRVIGGGRARGVCGSGLVDAIAVALDLKRLQPNGRLVGGESLRLEDPIEITQCDVRELQLAKGAIAAGVRLLARSWGTTVDGLAAVHLAGAFGNYINRASARRIGLLPFAADRIRPAGNTALLGAKLALFRPPGEGTADYGELRGRIEHVTLNDDPGFLDQYIEDMGFPAA